MRTYEQWLDEELDWCGIKHGWYISPTCHPYTRYVYTALMVEIEELKAQLAVSQADKAKLAAIKFNLS